MPTPLYKWLGSVTIWDIQVAQRAKQIGELPVLWLLHLHQKTLSEPGAEHPVPRGPRSRRVPVHRALSLLGWHYTT